MPNQKSGGVNQPPQVIPRIMEGYETLVNKLIFLVGRPTTFSRDVQVWGNLIGWSIPLIAVEPPHFGLVNVNVSKKTHLPSTKVLRNFCVNPNGF